MSCATILAMCLHLCCCDFGSTTIEERTLRNYANPPTAKLYDADSSIIIPMILLGMTGAM